MNDEDHSPMESDMKALNLALKPVFLIGNDPFFDYF